MVKIRNVLKIATYACALTGYAAVIRHVEIYISLSFAILLFLAIYLDCRRTVQMPRQIPRWLLNGFSLGILLFFFSRISEEYLIEPILNALLILVVIKLLEDRRFRDYMQVFVLCMFLLVGSSLLSLSAVFLVYFFLLVTLSTFSLILLAYFSQSEDLAVSRDDVMKLLRHALLTCGIALPLTLVFFILLPRTSYPLLNFLHKREVNRTGFTDTVTLGQVADIQENNQVVLRAEMPRVEERDLYWRGIVLDAFDGSAWSVGPSMKLEVPPLSSEGPVIRQTIYLEPYGNRYLFSLDKPVHIFLGDVRRSQDETYTLRAPMEKRTKYEVDSIASPFLPDILKESRRYLQLPPDFSPGIQAFIEEQKRTGTEDDWVQALQRLLTGGSYKYSLENLPVSVNPLEDFLFVQKQGNCEYFASALAVMLRMGGVPSRVVGGYRGGFYNRAGNYYLVLQSNAHVWVEAYLKGGWLRIDPTPPYHDGAGTGFSKQFSMQLKLAMDTFNYYWNRLVINYDLNKQMELLDALRSSLEKPRFKWPASMDPKALLRYLVLPLFALFVAGFFYRLHIRWKSPQERIAARFLKIMAAHGYQKGKGEGLEEFVARIDNPPLQEKARSFVEEFEEIFYKDEPFTLQTLTRLKDHLRAM